MAAAPHAVNRAVAAAAEDRRIFVNAVDDPPNASAYLGGVVRHAGVTVAISTDGRAPALAGLIRQAFDSAMYFIERAARAIESSWLSYPYDTPCCVRTANRAGLRSSMSSGILPTRPSWVRMYGRAM